MSIYKCKYIDHTREVKPTDRLLLQFESVHSNHMNQSFLYSQTLRLSRILSCDSNF